MSRLSRALAATFVVLLAPSVCYSQPASPRDIPWEECPCTGDLGNAMVNVPAGLSFTGAAGARQFMEMTGNIPSGNERGVVLYRADGQEPWFVVFSFDDIGYVKDDEKDSIDADEILSSIREGTEAANKLRKERGFDTLHISGWQKSPYYDTATNNLTWAILATGPDGGDDVVNHSVRLLGRHGVMNADLVLSPAQMDSAMPAFTGLVSGFDFKSGNRYREFTRGDRVAEIGLTALMAGGAGAALVKTGLLQKLWKVIVVGVAALFAALKKLFGRMTGKAEPTPESQNA